MSTFSQNEVLEYFKSIISQKDQRIAELESKLRSAEHKIYQLLHNASKRQMQGHLSKSSPEEIQVTSKDISFHIKEPLDTAHIAQIDNTLSSLKRSLPKASEFKLLIPPATKESRSSSIPQSKLQNYEEKSSGNPGYSQLDEMIFSNIHDKSGWNTTIDNLRNDPKLLSRALHSQGSRNNHKEIIMRNSRSRKQEYDKSRTAMYPAQFRPFSAKIERKWQEIDWSQTILDSYASKGVLEFNFLRDQTVFSPYEVEDLLRKTRHNDNWEQFYKKGLKTLDKLAQELMLPKGSFIIPPRSVENLEILLQECNKLFRARALVMKILTNIHKREDTLLRIMRFEEENENLKKNYNVFSQISQEVNQSIGFLSQIGLHLGEFIYLGENYSQKILQDDANIKELFPGLKTLEEL